MQKPMQERHRMKNRNADEFIKCFDLSSQCTSINRIMRIIRTNKDYDKVNDRKNNKSVDLPNDYSTMFVVNLLVWSLDCSRYFRCGKSVAVVFRELPNDCASME